LAGPTAAQSGQTIDVFEETLAVFTGDQKLRKLEQREQKLYRGWLDLLSAKTELEKLRKVRLAYRARDFKGEFLTVVLSADGDDGVALLDQDVLIESKSGTKFKGSVISIDDGLLRIRPGDRNRLEP